MTGDKSVSLETSSRAFSSLQGLEIEVQYLPENEIKQILNFEYIPVDRLVGLGVSMSAY